MGAKIMGNKLVENINQIKYEIFFFPFHSSAVRTKDSFITQDSVVYFKGGQDVWPTPVHNWK